MNAKRMAKRPKNQVCYDLTVVLKGDRVKSFVVHTSEGDRIERTLENYKDDSERFVEFDTVKGGVVFLNLQHVAAVDVAERCHLRNRNASAEIPRSTPQRGPAEHLHEPCRDD